MIGVQISNNSIDAIRDNRLLSHTTIPIRDGTALLGRLNVITCVMRPKWNLSYNISEIYLGPC